MAAADHPCGPEGTAPHLTRLLVFDTKIRIAGIAGLRFNV